MSPRRDRKRETTTREKSPQKTAFLLASYQLRVSEDWVVGTAGIEPVTPTSGDLVALRGGCIDAGVIIALSSRRINVSGNVVQQRASLS